MPSNDKLSMHHEGIKSCLTCPFFHSLKAWLIKPFVDDGRLEKQV